MITCLKPPCNKPLSQLKFKLLKLFLFLAKLEVYEVYESDLTLAI